MVKYSLPLCLWESASQGTSPAYWSWRLITLVWSHTRQFVISFISSLMSPSITLSLFHSRLKTHIFYKSFPPLFFYLSSHRTDSTHSSCFSFFSGMSVLTLAWCARRSWLLQVHIRPLHIIIIIIIIINSKHTVTHTFIYFRSGSSIIPVFLQVAEY